MRQFVLDVPGVAPNPKTRRRRKNARKGGRKLRKNAKRRSGGKRRKNAKRKGTKRRNPRGIRSGVTKAKAARRAKLARQCAARDRMTALNKRRADAKATAKLDARAAQARGAAAGYSQNPKRRKGKKRKNAKRRSRKLGQFSPRTAARFKNPKRRGKGRRNPITIGGINLTDIGIFAGTFTGLELLNVTVFGPKYQRGVIGGAVKVVTGTLLAIGLKKLGLISASTAATIQRAAQAHGVAEIAYIGATFLRSKLPLPGPFIGAWDSRFNFAHPLSEQKYLALAEQKYLALRGRGLGEEKYLAMNGYNTPALAGFPAAMGAPQHLGSAYIPVRAGYSPNASSVPTMLQRRSI